MTGTNPSLPARVRMDAASSRQSPEPSTPSSSGGKEQPGCHEAKRQSEGDGKLSLHDRDRKLVALPDLVFSLTVPLAAPRTVLGKGPLHPGRFHRKGAGHSGHAGRCPPLSLLRSSPLPFDLRDHRFPVLWPFSRAGRRIHPGPRAIPESFTKGSIRDTLGNLCPGKNPENPVKGRLMRQRAPAPESGARLYRPEDARSTPGSRTGS